MFGPKKVNVWLYREGSRSFQEVRHKFLLGTLQGFSRKAAATRQGFLGSQFEITLNTPQASSHHNLGRLLDYFKDSDESDSMRPFLVRGSLDTLLSMYMICFELQVPSRIRGMEVPCSAKHLCGRIVRFMASDRELPTPSHLALAFGSPLSKPVAARLAQALVSGELSEMTTLRAVVSRLPISERGRFQDLIDQAVALRTSLAALYQMPVEEFVVNTSWENWVRGRVPDNGFQQLWTPPVIPLPSVMHQINVPPPAYQELPYSQTDNTPQQSSSHHQPPQQVMPQTDDAPAVTPHQTDADNELDMQAALEASREIYNAEFESSFHSQLSSFQTTLSEDSPAEDVKKAQQESIEEASYLQQVEMAKAESLKHTSKQETTFPHDREGAISIQGTDCGLRSGTALDNNQARFVVETSSHEHLNVEADAAVRSETDLSPTENWPSLVPMDVPSLQFSTPSMPLTQVTAQHSSRYQRLENNNPFRRISIEQRATPASTFVPDHGIASDLCVPAQAIAEVPPSIAEVNELPPPVNVLDSFETKSAVGFSQSVHTEFGGFCEIERELTATTAAWSSLSDNREHSGSETE